MAKISRRSLLGGFLAGGAYTALSSTVPRMGLGSAHAHAGGDPFPTIFIQLYGGVDTAMHWDAKTGLPNRDVQAADIRETSSGIRWYQPLMGPLAAHMEDMTIVRSLSTTGAHGSGISDLWWGEINQAIAVKTTPWANYLSSELLTRKNVASPTIAVFREFSELSSFVNLSNLSPNPAGAAQRIQGLTDYANAMDVSGGLPDKEFQQRVYALSEMMDQRHYSPIIQQRTVDAFLAGNVQATELLNQPAARVWPPAQETQDLFNLSSDDLTVLYRQNNQSFVSNVAMAFESARLQTSHVMYIQETQCSFDSHENNDSRQRYCSEATMPALGKLITALKATPSPIDSSLSMLDTTHVVITSEMSRSSVVQTGTKMDGTTFDETGTIHNRDTQALLIGGNFKRGIAFGAMNEALNAIPVNLSTGALNEGEIPTFQNLQATILKANGVDPSAWTSKAPIDAVLK